MTVLRHVGLRRAVAGYVRHGHSIAERISTTPDFPQRLKEASQRVAICHQSVITIDYEEDGLVRIKLNEPPYIAQI